MRRVLGALALVLVVLAGAGVVYVYGALGALEVERVTDDVHVLFGQGGNVGVLATGRGAVVVDTLTFRMQGERIREEAERVGGGPPQLVINTHYHQDHTHGNPAFPAGTRVVSTANTLRYLEAFDAGYWEGDAGATLPSDVFEGHHELRIGDKTVRSLHVGRGHTGGDLVVLFVEDRVVHLGDLLFHGLYPSIDLEAGGSVREWADSLDRVLELEFDFVIPGHGPVTDRAGIVAFQRFLRELWALAEGAAGAGLGLEETLEGADLREDAGYGRVSFGPFRGPDRDFALRRAWEEATGAVSPAPLPAPPRGREDAP